MSIKPTWLLGNGGTCWSGQGNMPLYCYCLLCRPKLAAFQALLDSFRRRVCGNAAMPYNGLQTHSVDLMGPFSDKLVKI